jgi:cytochrome c oxidase subunit II
VRATPRRTGWRLGLTAAAVALTTTGCGGRDLYEDAFGLGFPKPVTEQGQAIYDLWLGSVAAAAVVGLGVWALIFWAVVRYRRNSDDLPRQIRYNLPVEVLYTVVPFVIIAVLFYYTVVAQNEVREEADEASGGPGVTINVVGFKWNWMFQHVDAGVQVVGELDDPATLVIPTDTTIRFVETSPDVIHSFFVPAFLFKQDVIPGRANTFEVKVSKEGTYIGRCAELCGEKHSQMTFFVRAVSPDAYAAYVAALRADPANALTDDPAVTGAPVPVVAGTPHPEEEEK